MKKLVAVLTVLAVLQLPSFSQCELPYGDFEQWEDITLTITESFGVNLSTEALNTPQGLVPAARLFFLLFEPDLQGLIDETPSDRLNTEILGYARTEESRSGDYALKIGGDQSIGLSDMLALTSCTDLMQPNFLSFYYKHYGTTADTLVLNCALGESATAMADADEFSDPAIGAYFQTAITTDEDLTNEWVWEQMSIQLNNSNLALDSMWFYLIRQSSATDSSSYFVIDDLQWNIETAVVDAEGNFVFQLGQSLDAKTIYPKLDHNNFQFVQAQIFDQAGRLIKTYDSFWKESIDVSALPRGNYFYQIRCKEGAYTKAFVRY